MADQRSMRGTVDRVGLGVVNERAKKFYTAERRSRSISRGMGSQWYRCPKDSDTADDA